MGKTVLDRLLAKSCPVPFSGCLVWTGDSDKDGYGFINVDGKRRLAHRVAYSIAKGEPKTSFAIRVMFQDA